MVMAVAPHGVSHRATGVRELKVVSLLSRPARPAVLARGVSPPVDRERVEPLLVEDTLLLVELVEAIRVRRRVGRPRRGPLSALLLLSP